LEFGMVCYTITDGFLAKPSANGLLINGHKIPTKRLEDGDIVVFGPGIKFKYHNLSKQKIAPNPKGLNSLAPYETEVLQHNQNQGNAMQRDAVYRNILQRQALQHDVQYNAMPPQAVQCKAAF
ncbi:MAG: FHA domain-containing protein, partial [Cyanobacteria bacterium P01_H01_bin.121]